MHILQGAMYTRPPRVRAFRRLCMDLRLSCSPCAYLSPSLHVLVEGMARNGGVTGRRCYRHIVRDDAGLYAPSRDIYESHLWTRQLGLRRDEARTVELIAPGARRKRAKRFFTYSRARGRRRRGRRGRSEWMPPLSAPDAHTPLMQSRMTVRRVRRARIRTCRRRGRGDGSRKRGGAHDVAECEPAFWNGGCG